jgi:spermidine/putrescine transport system substrate-binding protein
MKKVIAGLCLTLVLALFAVPGFAQDAITTDWTCPEGFAGQTLNVYNWDTYISDAAIPTFEALCGVEVNYEDHFTDNGEMITTVTNTSRPPYDVVFGNTYAIELLARQGFVETLDNTKIPNRANLGENWVGLPYDPDADLSVPYLWGTTGIGYNKEVVEPKLGGPVTSWDQLFEYDGPVAWLDDPRTMMSIALHLLGFDPNSTSEEEIQAAKDFLLEKSGNVVSIASDDGQALLERGEVDMIIEYSGDVYQLILGCECDTFNYVVPDEGSVVDMAAMFVPKDAPNPELAYVFMDYILDPAVNADIVTYTTYATPNQAAIESGLIADDLLSNPAVFPNEEMLATVWFNSDVSEAEGAEQAYTDAWDELLISVGS